MMKKEQYTIDDLIKIIERLREPDGCPWDRVQTHESIKKNMIEECYEAIDALDSGDDKAFSNELGDVLLQVVFHSVMAKERKAFTFDDVLNEVCNKLIDRHTHVFGEDKAKNADEALNSWEKNKKKEKNLDSYSAALKDVPHYLPSLMRAEKVLKKANASDFCKSEYTQGSIAAAEEELKNIKTSEEAEEKYGEILFDSVKLGRKYGFTPEISLTKTVNKFIENFEKTEIEQKKS